MATTKITATVAYDGDEQAPSRVMVRNLGVFWREGDTYTFTPALDVKDARRGSGFPKQTPQPELPKSRYRNAA